MIAQVEYSVAGRSRGRVILCVVCTVHVETRSTCFLVEPQNQCRWFVNGLTSKSLGRFVSGLTSKPLGDFLWFDPKTGGDGFLQFVLKTGGDGFLKFDLKFSGDGFLWFGLKTWWVS
jgi:hypothetical protein